MKAHLKPANAKAWALLKKLQALADQGIDGEKTSAQGKIARLTARFDFTVPEPAEAPGLFSGTFKRSTTARRVYAFDRNEYGVASSVKWAIEAATRIQCVFRDGELMAEATPATVKRLTEIAGHIACSFRALIDKFGEVDGVSANDRAVFVMGLYDGMMNETRNSGQRLPSRLGVKKRRKAKTHVSTDSPSLHIHPYTVASNLGKQIRFSAPLEEITAELEAVTRKHLAQKADQTD